MRTISPKTVIRSGKICWFCFLWQLVIVFLCSFYYVSSLGEKYPRVNVSSVIGIQQIIQVDGNGMMFSHLHCIIPFDPVLLVNSSFVNLPLTNEEKTWYYY